MSRYYRRKKPGPTENLRAGLVAGGIAAAVAAVSFYLTRVLMSRERLEPLRPPEPLELGEKSAKRTRRGGV